MMLMQTRTRAITGLGCFLSRPCVAHTSIRGVKKTAGDLKKGDFIEHKEKVYEILLANHQKVAMRGGFMIIEGRSIIDGSKLEEKFRSDMLVEEANVFVSRYDYDGMAEDGSEYFFVSEGKEKAFTKQQLNKLSPVIVDYLDYFKDDQQFGLKELNDEVISIDTPNRVTLKIKQTTPTAKGSSANMRDKPATLENGRIVKVPVYCENGDEVVIRLPDEVFVTRNK
eukprot:Phypoly_transcript_12861.p1 GENE.Phypoly_transcript_12861~~Phypoly_transcript_12861.p1  ORF type:complete len:225 (+),score=42.58 Phypoly_transcript_12861:346-1020(+)